MSKNKTPEEKLKNQLIIILRKRCEDAFDHPYNKAEYGGLLLAIESIEKLVPPSCFNSLLQQERDSQKEELEKAFMAGASWGHEAGVMNFGQKLEHVNFKEWYKQQQ